MSRGSFGIKKISDEDSGYEKESYNLTPWMQRLFEQNIAKQESAVEQARQRQSIVNQVNNIITNTPRYATVADAVNDMQERTGLKSYLNKIQASNKKKHFRKIIAQINANYNVPESLAKYNINDSIINFIINTIENNHSLSITIPQLQHEILHVFGPKHKIQPQDVLNEEVIEFLNDFILKAQSQLSSEEVDLNVGKGVGTSEPINPENQDYFAGLQPAKS